MENVKVLLRSFQSWETNLKNYLIKESPSAYLKGLFRARQEKREAVEPSLS
jgi:hypothetical protein